MSNAARSEGRVVEQAPEPQQWFTTSQAAAYLQTTPKALLMRVARGRIRPDCFGQRGAGREHLFSRETLDNYGRRDKAA